MARRWKVLLICSAGAFMPFLDATIVNIAFPDVERSFSEATRSGLSWILSAYNIVFAALLVPAGRLADSIGRKRVFLGGLALFTAASALCALAPSPEALVAGRVAQAAGGAALIPTSLALLLVEFPADRRATAVGLWGAAAGVAAASGPPLGGMLIEWADWRWIFLVNLPIGLVAWYAGRGVLVETARDEQTARPDLAGVGLITGAVALLALGFVEGQSWGWTSAGILGSFAGSALLLPIFLRRCARHPSPVIDLTLFRVRSFAIGNAGTLLFATAFYALMLCNVLFLTSVWGYSILSAGLAVSPAPLMAALVAGPAGRIADRVGHRVLAAPGSLAFALGCLWFALEVGPTPAFTAEWLPGAMLTGLGVGLAYPTLGAAAVTELPDARYGVGSAVNAMFRQLGAVFGVTILIALIGTPAPLDAPAAFDSGWIFSVLTALTAGAAALSLRPARAVATQQQPLEATAPA